MSRITPEMGPPMGTPVLCASIKVPMQNYRIESRIPVQRWRRLSRRTSLVLSLEPMIPPVCAEKPGVLRTDMVWSPPMFVIGPCFFCGGDSE